MTKKENILKDINNIDQKIKKLNAQKNLLLIQLESTQENTGSSNSRTTGNPIEDLRRSSSFGS